MTERVNRKKSLFSYIWKYKLQYAVGLFTLLMVDYIGLFIPQYTGEITDGLTAHTLGASQIASLVWKMILCGVVIAAGRFCWRYFLFGTARKIECELRNDMFAKLETLSQRYFNENKTGDLMTYFTNDLEAVRNALGSSIMSCFDSVVMTVLVLYKMMTYVSFRLTLTVLIPMALIAVFGYYFGEEFERRFSKKQQAFAKLSDHVQESISGERVIKAFVQEEKQLQAFERVNDNNRKANLGVVKLMATFGPSLDFAVGFTYAVTIIYGGYLCMIGNITLGRFIAFNTYIGSLVWPMLAFGDGITSVSQGIAGMRRLHQVFDEKPDISDPANGNEKLVLQGKITLKEVNFTYKDSLPNALSDITLEIQQGETLAILGRTGSGKTTLVNLLCRVYDITSGSIEFDGVDIKSIPLHILHENIAYVPQDNFLFSDTLAKNIAFGKPDAAQNEIIEACENACIHDNIIDFSEQYETMVGERGVTLSGGQKQRSSIARALLKDSPILILDDSLSAVDTDTEEKILMNLKKIRQNKTTIMIAHRVSTVQNADHILILDEGKMIEYGTYDELMDLGGVFKTMVQKQQLEKQLEVENNG